MKKLNPKVLRKINNFFDNPAYERKFHAYWTLIWLVLIPISALTGLKESIGWVVLMSAWANFAGHFSAWQASKAEDKLEKKVDKILEHHGR